MSLLDDLGGKLNKLTGKLKDADLGDKISEVGNNVADALSMGAKTAYGRAKNAAEVGGLKLKLADARKEEAAAFEKFGRRYMELHGEDADPDLLDEIEAIKAAGRKVEPIRKAIEDSRAAQAAAEAEMKEKAEEQKAADVEEDAGDEFPETVTEEERPAEHTEEGNASEEAEEESASEPEKTADQQPDEQN